MFLIIFMYLFNRSLRAETHLGCDGTRLKQNAQARLKAYISMLTNWSMEIKRERETDLKTWDEGKEDHGHSQQIN